MEVEKEDGSLVFLISNPWMQQFMGKVISGLRKAEIRSRGTGRFSVLTEPPGQSEVEFYLEEFWPLYENSGFSKEALDSVVQTIASRVRGES